MSKRVKEFQEAFDRACESTRWMAAVWHVAENGRIVLATTTNSFMFDDFDEAVRILRLQLDQRKESERAELPLPLPVADFPWMKKQENCEDEAAVNGNGNLVVGDTQGEEEVDSTEVGQQVEAASPGSIEGVDPNPEANGEATENDQRRD